MKKILFLMALLMSFKNINGVPRIRLHLDVNKTIIASDSVQNKGLNETLNAVLAEFTFHLWDGKSEESYHSYVTKKLTREFPALLQASDEFKHRRAQLLSTFPDYLKSHHPELFGHYQAELKSMLVMLQESDCSVFPSFFALVDWLEKYQKNNYSLHLRTFGTDLPDVMSAIQRNSQLRFSSMKELSDKQENLYEFLLQLQGNHGIRDSYARWKEHGFAAEGAKPFPVDPTNKTHLSIFFDDNADDSVKPILCPLLPDGKIGNTQQLLQTGNIVAVNTKQAILDREYFIKKIQALLVEPKQK